MNKKKLIEEDINLWLKNFTNQKIKNKINFVKEDYVDSFNFLNLILYLEKNYKTKFSNNFLQNANNYSINKITNEILKNIK